MLVFTHTCLGSSAVPCDSWSRSTWATCPFLPVRSLRIGGILVEFALTKKKGLTAIYRKGLKSLVELEGIEPTTS